MRKAVSVVYRRLTQTDLFNIYKPPGTEETGGGQTYIDFPATRIPLKLAAILPHCARTDAWQRTTVAEFHVSTGDRYLGYLRCRRSSQRWQVSSNLPLENGSRLASTSTLRLGHGNRWLATCAVLPTASRMPVKKSTSSTRAHRRLTQVIYDRLYNKR